MLMSYDHITAGRRSFKKGIQRDRNPYRAETRPWKDWDAGWLQAFQHRAFYDAKNHKKSIMAVSTFY